MTSNLGELSEPATLKTGDSVDAATAEQSDESWTDCHARALEIATFWQFGLLPTWPTLNLRKRLDKELTRHDSQSAPAEISVEGWEELRRKKQAHYEKLIILTELKPSNYKSWSPGLEEERSLRIQLATKQGLPGYGYEKNIQRGKSEQLWHWDSLVNYYLSLKGPDFKPLHNQKEAAKLAAAYVLKMETEGNLHYRVAQHNTGSGAGRPAVPKLAGNIYTGFSTRNGPRKRLEDEARDCASRLKAQRAEMEARHSEERSRLPQDIFLLVRSSNQKRDLVKAGYLTERSAKRKEISDIHAKALGLALAEMEHRHSEEISDAIKDKADRLAKLEREAKHDIHRAELRRCHRAELKMVLATIEDTHRAERRRCRRAHRDSCDQDLAPCLVAIQERCNESLANIDEPSEVREYRDMCRRHNSEKQAMIALENAEQSEIENRRIAYEGSLFPSTMSEFLRYQTHILERIPARQ